MDIANAIYSAAYWHLVFFSGFIILSAFAVVILVLSGGNARWAALMTGVWVMINGAIAYWLSRHIFLPPPQILPRVFSHITAYMWVNVGLDMLYCLAAWYLLKREGRYRQMLISFGRAVMAQGIGLLILDVIFLVRVMWLHELYLNR